MSVSVNTNVNSLLAQRNLSGTKQMLQRSMNRLSSGNRINSAADDAAGLSISEKMTAVIRSYSVAERNTNDGISLATTAEGALGQIAGLLQRMRELAVQASNGTLGSGASSLDNEFKQLSSEIDRIAVNTDFNTVKLLNSASNAITFQVGVNSGETISVNSVNVKTSTGAGNLKIDATVGVTTSTAASSAIGRLDTALDSVNTGRTTFGSIINRFQVTVANIQTMRTNLSAANSRIRDVDVADESATLSRYQILQQAGIGILAQANVSAQSALSLLRS